MVSCCPSNKSTKTDAPKPQGRDKSLSVQTTCPQTSTPEYIVLPNDKIFRKPSEAWAVRRAENKVIAAAVERAKTAAADSAVEADVAATAAADAVAAAATAEAAAASKDEELRRRQRCSLLVRIFLLFFLLLGLPLGFVWHVQADDDVGQGRAKTVQNWTLVVSMPENVQQWVCSGVLPAPNITLGRPVPPGPIGACMVCRIHQLWDLFHARARPYAFAGTTFSSDFADTGFAACVRHFRVLTLRSNMCTDFSTEDVCHKHVNACVYDILPTNRTSELDCMTQARQRHAQAEAEAQANQTRANALAEKIMQETLANQTRAEALAKEDQESLISTVFGSVVAASGTVLTVMATLRQP